MQRRQENLQHANACFVMPFLTNALDQSKVQQLCNQARAAKMGNAHIVGLDICLRKAQLVHERQS